MLRDKKELCSLSRLNLTLKERSNGMKAAPKNPKNYIDKPFFGNLIKPLPDMEVGTSVHFYIDDSANEYRIKLIAFVNGSGMLSNTIPFDKGPDTIGRVIGNKKFTLDELKDKYAEAEESNNESLPW